MTFKLIDPLWDGENRSQGVVRLNVLTRKRTYVRVEVQRNELPALVAAHELGHVRATLSGAPAHAAMRQGSGPAVVLRAEAEAWRLGLAGYRRVNGPLAPGEKALIRKYFGSYVEGVARERAALAQVRAVRSGRRDALCCPRTRDRRPCHLGIGAAGSSPPGPRRGLR